MRFSVSQNYCYCCYRYKITLHFPSSLLTPHHHHPFHMLMRSSLKFRRPTKKVSSLILIRTRDLIELLKKFFMCFDGRHWKFVISHGFQMNFDEISNLSLLLLLWCHQYSHQLSRIKWRLTFFFNFPTFSEPIENGKKLNSNPISFAMTFSWI